MSVESCADLGLCLYSLLLHAEFVSPCYSDTSGHAVSTGSSSDRVVLFTIYNAGLNCDPVASTTSRGLPARGPRSAPGTDLILKLYVICAAARLMASRIRT